MIDASRIGFALTGGPYRHSDGSFKFTVVVFVQPKIIGQTPEIKATAEVHVASDQLCNALGQALINVAQQLPPELAMAGN